ncbi:hypothetical protein CRE_01637 [Caenorhabditis remanei]|uniref:Uncharacterized protein n=2 Tax=Caenorhabditis remanei TaxID=31234 RepID=E3LGX4_CAERE|nr:hypothetical protein CRE_01637 [Caenorhabditis remanei]
MEVNEVDMDCNLPLVQLPQSGERVNVPLVQSRSEDQRLVTNARQTDKIDADDLVALANQLNSARQLVKGRACDRLKQIADQMEQLHMAARAVLEDAQRDEELHNVPCNMQKQPGRIYHLYQKQGSMDKYFSMLAPNEWGYQEKKEEYLGSYRLEYDRSWTPVGEMDRKDEEVARLQQILQRNAAGTGRLTWGS